MKIINLLPLIFCLSIFYANAQDKSIVLTINEAVKIGLENNVNLNTQKNQLQANQARKVQSIVNFLPSVDASASFQRQDGIQIIPNTGAAASLTSDQFQSSVRSDFNIFNGFNRINTLIQNNNLVLAQTALVNRSHQDVINLVSSQYLQVLLDQELLRIAEENLNAQKVTLEQIKGQVEVGARAVTDEYNQNAQVKALEVTYLRAKITLENDRAVLSQTLQLDPAASFTVAKPNWVVDSSFLNSITLDSLYEVALNNRSDYKQQQYLVKGNLHGIRASTSGYLPTLSAFASYGSFYFVNDGWKTNPDVPKPVSFNEQFRNLNPQLAYGLSLSIPIFDRLQTRTNRIVNKVAYQNAILTRDNLEKSIKIDVQRSYRNFVTAIESYKSSLIQFEAAELAQRTQQESFDLGVSAQVALAQANQTFIQAAASKAQAEFTLLFQKILLDYALGTLKVEDIP
jgi:outer membrane protein